MKRMMVHRQHAEEMIIEFGNGFSWPVLVDVTDFKIFEVSAKWPVMDAHVSIVASRFDKRKGVRCTI